MASSRVYPSTYDKSTLGASGCDYVSFAAWESDTDIDLSVATGIGKGKVLDCKAETFALSAGKIMGGGTTDSACYRVVAGAGHDGVSSGTKFTISSLVGNFAIRIAEDYSRLYDLIGTGSFNKDYHSSFFLIAAGKTGARFIGCIAYGVTNNFAGTYDIKSTATAGKTIKLAIVSK